MHPLVFCLLFLREGKAAGHRDRGACHAGLPAQGPCRARASEGAVLLPSQQQEACDHLGAGSFCLSQQATGWAPSSGLAQLQWHCQCALPHSSVRHLWCGVQQTVSGSTRVAVREWSQLCWHPKASAPTSDQLYKSTLNPGGVGLSAALDGSWRQG